MSLISLNDILAVFNSFISFFYILASLQAAQKALESVLAEVKAVEGVTGVTRTVCGGCLDFKVSTSLSADKFGDWEEKKFAPEADFLKKLEGIDGISMIETQTFTIMPM